MTTSRRPGAVVAPVPPPARPARVLVVLLLLLAVLTTVAPAVLTARTAAAAPQPGAATVELQTSTPTLARPGDTVELSVRVTNGTDRPLDGAVVDLGVSWRPLTSRAELAAWADDGGTRTAVRQLPSEPVDRLAPGESAQVSLELDVDALGFEAESPWGPREMSVALVQGGRPLDVVHTFLLYAPEGGAPSPVAVSVAAPVTGPAVDPLDADGYDAQLAELTTSGGRLERLLDAATVSGSSPGMSLAVDPALVAAAESSDDADVQAWATRLTGRTPPAADDDGDDGGGATDATNAAASTGAAGDAADVAVLPGYDPDLAAVAHTRPTRADVAAATGGEAALGSSWQRPQGWSLSLAWPHGRPDAATLATGRDAPVDQVVVASGLAPTSDVPASARTAVDTPSGKVSALVADAGLSAALASLTDDAGAPTAAEGAQRLLADTALLALQAQEAGTGDLHVLAALPRDWSPDAALVGQVLAALQGATWADVVPLSDTVAAPASRVARHGLPRNDVADAELAPLSVDRLLGTHRSVSAFATVADDPVELSGDVDQALVAPLAVAARKDLVARDQAVDLAVERADDLQQGIGVADRSDVTLVSDTGKLPVKVTNELPVDATVTVVLRPNVSRLVVESRPTVVVPAGTSMNVHVPVRAIGSGDVDLQVEVLAPSGAVVAGPTSFSVRVRAGWETAGTAVVAAAIALLFIGGIWRTVRRGRSSARTTDEGVADAVDPQGPDAGPQDGTAAATPAATRTTEHDTEKDPS
ncbi:DUF6049 family protein [Isoptericola sp. NPDC057559]|uniref:DUF6049 family protein n=1 Tax=Isoptericola sp. NPDC057559 TaxID=3346168 RepID=UPI0036B72E64